MNESDNPFLFNLQGGMTGVFRRIQSRFYDFIQGGSFKEVIVRTVSLLIDLRDREGKNLFSGVSVILPPASVTSLTANTVYEAVAAGAKVWS